MSKDLEKSKENQPDLPKPPELAKGDQVIDDDGRVFTVNRVVLKPKKRDREREPFVEVGDVDEDGKFHLYGDIKLARFVPSEDRAAEWIKLTKPYEEVEREVLDEVKDLSKYTQPTEDAKDNECRALQMQGDPASLQNFKKNLLEQHQKLAIMHRVLERKKDELYSIMDDMMEKVHQVRKVIGIIELYLGVNEEILQIQEGTSAVSAEPIYIHQQILFMDEEVGDPEDGGLDFKSLDVFDKWVCESKNLKKILPHPKGIVVLRPRRRDKQYEGEDLPSLIRNAFWNEENKKTYILIRNGDNIYRIWADITIWPRMFPLLNEAEKLQKCIDGESVLDDNGFMHLRPKEAQETLTNYRRNALMIQGLLDRTTIFAPLPHPIKMSDPSTYGEIIKFIRDDELALTEGREYWKDWHKRLNSQIKVGTRIYFSGFTWRDMTTGKDGNAKYHLDHVWASRPAPGVYKVVEIIPSTSMWDRHSGMLVCLYQPSGYEDRGRKVSFRFYLHASEGKVLNYDLMSLEDVEYYLESRIDRGYYLDSMPVLRRIRKVRLEELHWEKGFVENLVSRSPIQNKEELEKVVWEAIDWWKMKVLMKRPLTEDDAKAMRMIPGKVLRMCKERGIR